MFILGSIPVDLLLRQPPLRPIHCSHADDAGGTVGQRGNTLEADPQSLPLRREDG